MATAREEMAGETETDRVTAAMVALLEKKHKGVKAPVDVIDKWTLLALEQYFESQAYLNSMLMSSSEDDASAEGAVGESEADEAQASAACAAKDARASIPIQALKVEDDDEGRPRQKREARDDRGVGVLIYGATGYTGRLISKACREAGLDVTVAGRNAASVRALALELGAPSVAFSLDNEAALDEAVGRAAVVVHCAGPFAQTYSAVVESCLRKGAHYVDINGEIEVIEAISKYAQEAEEKGLMLLPAAGFDVVPSDTLAHLVAERFKSCYPAHFPSKLEIFFHYNDQGKLFPRSLSSLFAASDLISLSLSRRAHLARHQKRDEGWEAGGLLREARRKGRGNSRQAHAAQGEEKVRLRQGAGADGEAGKHGRCLERVLFHRHSQHQVLYVGHCQVSLLLLAVVLASDLALLLAA